MSAELGDSNFLSTVSNLLKEGNTAQVLALFLDNKNKNEISQNSWDLIPIISNYLTEDCDNNNVGVFKCCQKLICVIAENSNPEEVLLQFIEEIELAKDDTKFLALLKPLETVLLRVPDKRITSLGWCFNAIRQYLGKVKSPEEHSLEEEERLLLDSDDSVNRITDLYDSVLLFCDTLLKELNSSNNNTNYFERKQIVGKFLLDLIGKPLAFLNTDIYKNTKPKARLLTETLIKIFCSLSLNPFSFFEVYENNDLVKPNDLSLGIFYYFLFSEEVCLNNVPKVYNPAYILQNSLNLVNNLLGQECQFLIEKGISLTAALLKSIDPLELSYLMLDSEYHSKFCISLSNIIIHNESEQWRKKSLEVLHKYLWSFEHQGRFLIIINLMRHLNHSGLKGNIIMQYKEMITQEIKNGNLNRLPKYYKEQKLMNLLDGFTLLRNNEETDLVDESDQIVSTLNFLRYLILIDKTGVTGISGYLKSLEEGYFKHLKTGITLAQEHYQLKIKEVKEEDLNKKREEDCQMSVTVSGKNLSELSTARKIEIMNMSLTTLDVINSLLSRLIECIHLKMNE